MKRKQKAKQHKQTKHTLYKKSSAQGTQKKKKTEEPLGTSQWYESVREAAVVSPRSEPSELASERGVFTPGEMGLPEADGENPQGQGGPVDQEGEGNRQTDQAAELASDVDAKEDLERRR